MRLMSWMKPMSSMRSASSSTSISTWSRRTRALVDEIEQAARCCHQNFDTMCHRSHLAIDRHAADRKRDGKRADVAAVSAEAVRDLSRQFARRREHQHAAGFLFRPQALGGQVIDDRQREGRRLAGPGLRNTDDVAALQHERNGLFLDRSGGDVFLFGEGAKDRLCEAEIVE